MFQALNVALEIGRGLGMVRPAGFFEQLESLLLRYASGAMTLFFKVMTRHNACMFPWQSCVSFSLSNVQ